MIRPLPIKLADEDAERVRRSHHEAIASTQSRVEAPRIVRNVSLADGIPTTFSHGLGKVPSLVTLSVLRGAVSAGFIVETIDGVDRSRFVVLTASGYGATISLDLKVE